MLKKFLSWLKKDEEKENFMRIKIEEVPPQGLHKETSYDPKALDMEIQDSPFSLPVSFPAFIEASADIRLIDKELIVNIVVKYRLTLTCSRCLETFELPFEKGYLFHYNTQNLEVIDVTDRLREEIILTYPLKPLCRKDCRGICPGCGVNLNYEECRCKNKKIILS